jgi:hypothetical protein
MDQHILTELKNGQKSARDLVRVLKGGDEETKKKTINSALYRLQKEGKVVKTETTPPLWSLSTVSKTGVKRFIVISDSEGIKYLEDTMDGDVFLVESSMLDEVADVSGENDHIESYNNEEKLIALLSMFIGMEAGSAKGRKTNIEIHSDMEVVERTFKTLRYCVPEGVSLVLVASGN